MIKKEEKSSQESSEVVIDRQLRAAYIYIILNNERNTYIDEDQNLSLEEDNNLSGGEVLTENLRYLL